VAGGGGGGGAQLTPESIGGIGGRGGIAVAGMDGDRSCGGGSGSPARDENNPTDRDAVGGGGNGGAGRCDGSRAGSGGVAGSGGGADGVSGVGGHGGRKTGNANGATWIDSGITAWTAGNGGDPAGSNAGAGGGGFGGGGAGGTSSRGFIANGAGGGGGGSWARQATYDDLNAPVRGILQSPSGSGKGAVTLTFDVCTFDPGAPYCSGVGIARIQPEMSLVASPSDRQLRLRIHGSETFDVGAIDTSRFAFGFAAVEPTRIQRKDLDADGFDDLELRFRVDHLPPTRPGGEHDALEQDGVHCLFGASVSGESFHACVRAELPGVRGTVRSNRTRGESRALRSPSAR
jgi:hypothetical protein